MDSDYTQICSNAIEARLAFWCQLTRNDKQYKLFQTPGSRKPCCPMHGKMTITKMRHSDGIINPTTMWIAEVMIVMVDWQNVEPVFEALCHSVSQRNGKYHPWKLSKRF
jgi:hypothetical protein